MTKIFTTLFALATFGAAAVAADALDTPKPKPYPLDTCVVTGEKLGEMGDAVVVTRAGREIKFCCKGCIKKFDKDPAPYVKKLEAAEKAKTDMPAGMDHSQHQH